MMVLFSLLIQLASSGENLSTEASICKNTEKLKTVLSLIDKDHEKSGFDNLSNFNRLFKKKFEMTPSQFRQSNLDNK